MKIRKKQPPKRKAAAAPENVERPPKRSFAFNRDKTPDDSDPDTVFTPVLPEVDLLPLTLREAAHVLRIRAELFGVALIVAAALSVGFLAQQGLLVAANQSLQSTTNEASMLAQQLAKYQSTKAFYEQIDFNKAQILVNMSKEVDTANVFETLRATSPNGITLTSVDTTITTSVVGAQNAANPTTTTTDVAEGCPQINLFATGTAPAYGCAKVTGSATNRDVLSAWVKAIQQESMFISPFVSESSSSGSAVTFTASIGLTAKVYSLRYKLGYLTKEQF